MTESSKSGKPAPTSALNTPMPAKPPVMSNYGKVATQRLENLRKKLELQNKRMETLDK